MKKSKLRTNFHQAKWDEEIIFELHNPGERGIMIPDVEKEIEDSVGDGIRAHRAYRSASPLASCNHPASSF